MDDLALRSLALALETGSLTAAARRLGVSQPAISQKIAGLEAAVGQQLLVRSRHGVQPTAAGLLVNRHGLRVLASLAEMQSALEDLRGQVSGKLRVTVNMLFGQAVMGPVLALLRERHPGLRVDVITSDAVIDLEAEGVDIAVRGGRPGDGTGLVRRIGFMEGVLIALPAYLDAVGRPEGPEDLQRLSYIQYRDDPEEHSLALARGEEALSAPVSVAFSAQHPDLTLHAVLNGIGFAKAPLFHIRDRLEAGTLEVVLPGYVTISKPLYLVYRAHLKDTPNVRAFRAALVEHLAGLPGFAISADLAA
ncbi:LysR family transcriptional regulator [Devosia riboflavina]|uniref:LysR family transcriptional regulator n=1 Tax=Devosia riboflavina TaxID=46914 RepID=UPI00068BF3CE|nr:LysR family transcriptional regulator [Devosia riboflavina]